MPDPPQLGLRTIVSRHPAEAGYAIYEATAPKHHWSDWYAAYISAREQGRSPEEAANAAALHMEAARS
jgi:hypothetical protein